MILFDMISKPATRWHYIVRVVCHSWISLSIINMVPLRIFRELAGLGNLFSFGPSPSFAISSSWMTTFNQ